MTRSHNTPRPDPVRPHIASEMSALASASSVFTGAYPRGSRTIGNPRRGRANPTAGRSRQTTASDSRARVSSATTPLTVSPSLPPFPTGRSVRVAAPKRTVARASRVAATAKLEAGDKVKVRTDVHSRLLVINHHRQINNRSCQNRSDRSSATKSHLHSTHSPHRSTHTSQVTSKFIVYHVPKGDRKNGTDLSGWEGVVDSRADDLNGVYISANLEVKVKFDVPNDPKGKTFIVHCKEDELEKQ